MGSPSAFHLGRLRTSVARLGSTHEVSCALASRLSAAAGSAGSAARGAGLCRPSDVKVASATHLDRIRLQVGSHTVAGWGACGCRLGCVRLQP
jgi:hypothetical protein